MLDECKGEKFEEVLGAFSTLVLQRVLEAEQNPQPTRTRRLVLAQRLTCEEQQSLLPLAIAHRSSLSTLLRKKARLSLKYREFKTVLDAKQLEIRTKANNNEVSKAGEISLGPLENIRRLNKYFELHWQGDSRWIEEIFGQGKQGTIDPLLDTPFSDLWTRLTGSTADQPAPKQQGLLQQLEERVAAQEARLKQWKKFREDLQITSTKVENVRNTMHNQVFDLKFSSRLKTDPHPDSTGEGITQDSAAQESIAVIVTEYQGLMDYMSRELAAVDAVNYGSDQNHMAALSKKQGMAGLRQLSSSMGLEIAKSCHPEPLRLTTKVNARNENGRNHDSKTSRERMGTDSDQEFNDSGELRPILSGPAAKRPIKRLEASAQFSNWEPGRSEYILSKTTKDPFVPVKLESNSNEVITSLEDSRVLLSKSDQITSGQEDEAPTNLNEKEFLTQQIISSTINNISPVKPKLSLLERTRRSMALVKPELIESATVVSASIISIAENALQSSDAPIRRRETLLERTRQSMSLITPKPPLQKGSEQRRTSKIYPTNQFETPGKQQSASQKDELSTPPELLFEQDANYDSVFKSRPKVALSPTATSMIMHDELDDIIEGESSEDDHDYGAFVGASNGSPSVRAKESNMRS